MEETFCKIIVCSSETMTSARIRNLRDLKRQPPQKIAEGLVPTSVISCRGRGDEATACSAISTTARLLNHSPQPLICTLQPAAVGASAKLGEGVPRLSLLLGRYQGSKWGAASLSRALAHTDSLHSGGSSVTCGAWL